MNNRPWHTKSSTRLAISAVLCGSLLPNAIAQTIEGTEFRTHLSRAIISASGAHLTAERLPVIASNGKVYYYDISFKLADIDGTLALHIDDLAESPTPPIISLPFSGTYQDTATEVCYEATAAAPYTGGRNVFVLQEITASFDDCYEGSGLFKAEFVSGPAKNHPNMNRTEEDAFTDETYTYGRVVDKSEYYYGGNMHYGDNTLLGIRVQGNGDLKVGKFVTNNDPKSAPYSSTILRRIE